MKISAVLPDELGAALEQRARTEDRSASAVIRRALTEHLAPPLVQVVPESRTPTQSVGAGASHSGSGDGAVGARARRGAR